MEKMKNLSRVSFSPIKKNRANPESSTLLPFSPQPVKSLKRCESTLSIRANKQSEWEMLQQKYKQLQQNYHNLLTETIRKKETYELQKAEIEGLQSQHESNLREINCLKECLGWGGKNKSQKRSSVVNKSVCDGFRKKQESVTCNSTAYRGKKSMNTFYKDEEQEKRGLDWQRKSTKKRLPSCSRSKEPTHIYKFVPTLPLK